MGGKLYFVVGDDYQQFASNENVLTESELMDVLDSGTKWHPDDRVVCGQGLSLTARKNISQALLRHGIASPSPSAMPAPAEQTHKKTLDHVLVSAPVQVLPRTYQFDLLVGDECDRLSDHVTGQHLGAMLLLEAARQAVIVTLEQEYSAGQKGKWGLILEKYNSQYTNYAFPLPTQLTVEVSESGKISKRQIPVSLAMAFEQAGRTISHMSMDVLLYDTALLNKVEARGAREALSQAFKGNAPEVPTERRTG